ncbi:hypothetical protein JW916_03190 [Candidatus Sumerlaeota bacterium]|nr:hypothetical protein [Candidatus Sumerlaeota bacterium]
MEPAALQLNRLLRSPATALFAASLALAVLPTVVFGPALIDDAYITFRYAENIASGRGFVFNVSDGPILGTSTPLFTLLLAAGRTAGAPLPTLAMALSVLGAALTFFSGILLFRQAGGTRQPVWAGLTWAAVLTTSPHWIFTMISGMETILFVGLGTSALAAAAARRRHTAALLAGLTVLTRYDGWALALIVLAWIVWDSKRQAWLSLVLFAATQIPWVVYALATFGSYVPHSVEAKRVIQPRLFSENLLTQLRFLAGRLEGMPTARFNLYLLVFFLVGIALLAFKRSRILALPLWGLASLLGFSASRILIQSWYLAPELVAFSWVAVWGVWALCGLRNPDCGMRIEEVRSERGTADPPIEHPESGIPNPKSPIRSSQSAFRNPQSAIHWFLPVLVAVVLIAVHLRAVLPHYRRWPLDLIHRERVYLEAAGWIRAHALPGASVLVGEVGAVAWALPECRVIDSSGINSDRVLRARRADRVRIERSGARLRIPDSGTPEWVREVIRAERPDYLVTVDTFLHLDTLRAEDWFKETYAQKVIYRAQVGATETARISIYARERRPISPAL